MALNAVTCEKCGRANCRVAHWEAIARCCTRLELEDVQRALNAARVSCFIRTRAAIARAAR